MKNKYLVLFQILILLFGFLSFCHAETFKSDYLSVRNEGKGQGVILIPGLASSADVWLDTIIHLKNYFQLHIVSFAGFAGTSPPNTIPENYLNTYQEEILRYIRTSQMKEPILIGHSMGGLVALLAGSQNNVKIESIIVLDSLPFLSLFYNPNTTSEKAAPYAKSLEINLLNMDDKQFEAHISRIIPRFSKIQEKRSLIRSWLKTTNRLVHAQLSRELITYDARSKLKNISCPVTILYAYDSTMPIQKDILNNLYKDSYSSLKNVIIHEISNSYHFLMWDNPAEFKIYLNEALNLKSP